LSKSITNRRESTIVLAGRRIDAPNTEAPRFALSRIAAVAIALHTLFRRRRATVLVSAAACGADLVALVAARSLGMRRRIVLPFSPAKFREESVIDRPGDWGELYDELIAEAKATGDLVVLNNRPKLADAFTATNERLIEEAFEMSGETANARVRKSRLIATIVWEGRPRGEGDYTQGFAELAKTRGLSVREVLTN
jgi:hypothetical protein